MTDKHNQLLLDALENERRYTAKEMHDGVAQTTLQLGLQIGICRKLLERNNLEMLNTELLQLEDRIHKASSQIKELIQDLRPPTLDEESTGVGLEAHINYAIDIHRERGGPPVTYQFNAPQAGKMLLPAQILGLTRLVQEGLLNVRKHAQAEHVRLTVSTEQDHLYLTIADDGKGFDTSEVEARLMEKGGVGLHNLKIRTQAIGGTLTVARDSIGNGTKITVILPLT